MSVEEASEPNTLLVMQTPHKSKARKPRVITIPNDSTSESEELVYVVNQKRKESKEQMYLFRSNEKRKRKNDEFVMMKGSNVVYLNDRKKKAIVLPERRQKEYIMVSDTPEKPDSPH
jgi:hypothetical protein